MSKTHAKTVFKLAPNSVRKLRISGELVTKIATHEGFPYDVGTQRTVPFCLGRAAHARTKDRRSRFGTYPTKLIHDVD